MQDNVNEWQSQQERTSGNDGQEHPQVPSSLLSNILHHLELSPEQTPSEPSLDDLLLKLRSTAWQDRTLALHALEKLKYPVSIDLLSPFLQDKDATVRAATVHALSMISKQVPLHWLIEAFHDPNWHVREVAVFALAKQGARVPREIFMAALHDKDGSVREAASFVLQQNSVDHNSSGLYGQLREETPMHNELYDPTRLNGQSNGHSPENTPPAEWSGVFMEYSGNSAHPHTVNEQVQAYAAGQYTPHNATSYENSPDEYAEMMPSRHEKLTSYRLRRKSHKGWWAITIVLVAFLLLGVGRVSSVIVPQINISIGQKDAKNVIVPVPITDHSFPMKTDYSIIMQKTLSSALHLTSQQLLAKLKERGSLNVIAVDQGVSTSVLAKAELNAFNTILQNAVSTGQISSTYADQLMNQLQKNSDLREKIAITLLTAAPTP
jgi:HEAT repeats